MAKRVPAGEVPYRPLDKVLVSSVMSGTPAPAGGGSVALATPPTMPAVSVREPVLPREETPVVPFPRPTPPELQATPPQAPRKVEPRPAPGSDGMPERRDREKRVLLTEAEDRDIERLVHRLAGDFKTPVKLSHLLRASLTAMLNAENELVEKAKRTTLSRPGNGNAPELAQFEHTIAQVLVSALREARPLR